jgi:multiple sugar transport system permease protein
MEEITHRGVDMENRSWKKWIWYFSLVAALIVFYMLANAGALATAVDILAPFIGALAVAFLLLGPCRWIEQRLLALRGRAWRVLARPIAITVVYLAAVGIIALLISLGLNSITTLKKFFQTVYFLPYVTNTLAVGLVFMILFKKTAYTDGLANLVLSWFGKGPVDFIDGPYWAKMFVLCFYTIWVVMPFKVLILTSALASVNQDYYNAAKVDGTSPFRIFHKITLPMISPMIFYLVITGFIGAFKAYSDAVALFGTNLNAAGMNTIVGYVYDKLYGDGGGYPSYASAAAIILFAVVFTITMINLSISKKNVHY